MMRPWGLGGLGAIPLAMAVPAAAQLNGEHLVAPADPGFRLGFADSRVTAMQEYVPRGETVEDWTRMITVQRFAYRPGMAPAALLRRWLGGLAQMCGVATPPEPTSTTVAGHAAADGRFDCPRNPRTGKPETVLARIIVGDDAVHWIQAATRRSPNPADLDWAGRVVAETTLCAATSADRHCLASQQPAIGAPL